MLVCYERSCFSECCLKAAAYKCGGSKFPCCERIAFYKKVYIPNTSSKARDAGFEEVCYYHGTWYLCRGIWGYPAHIFDVSSCAVSTKPYVWRFKLWTVQTTLSVVYLKYAFRKGIIDRLSICCSHFCPTCEMKWQSQRRNNLSVSEKSAPELCFDTWSQSCLNLFSNHVMSTFGKKVHLT